MFVLQLMVNKREISVHIGQQRGSTEGDLVDPYVFTRSVQSISVPHEGPSHFHVWRAKNLFKTKFVTGKATGMKSQRSRRGKKRMMNNCWRWSLLSETVGRSRRRNREELHWVLRISPSVYWYMSSSCLVWRRLLLYVVGCGAAEWRGGGGWRLPHRPSYTPLWQCSQELSAHISSPASW